MARAVLFSATYLYILGLLSHTLAAETDSKQFSSFGIVLFRAFDPVDIYGPVDILQLLSKYSKLDVAFISETLNPVTTEPLTAMMNPLNSTVWPTLPPTHTFETAPELDVLIIPGGPGMRSPNLNATLDYIARTAPKVKHVITVCTGSGLAARAGILNGRKATTNKTSWPGIIPFGPNTTWIGHARWVEDNSTWPPIWSSSGVTAGLDLMYHFVETYYSAENATYFATLMEYGRHTDPSWDPWARNDTNTTLSSKRDTVGSVHVM